MLFKICIKRYRIRAFYIVDETKIVILPAQLGTNRFRDELTGPRTKNCTTSSYNASVIFLSHLHPPLPISPLLPPPLVHRSHVEGGGGVLTTLALGQKIHNLPHFLTFSMESPKIQ